MLGEWPSVNRGTEIVGSGREGNDLDPVDTTEALKARWPEDAQI